MAATTHTAPRHATAHDSAHDSADGKRRPHYQVTFVVLMVSVSSYALLQSLVLPVLPTIQKGLHTTQTNVTWVLTAYLLSASIFTPIFGRVGDMVGKKKVLVGVLLALLFGSVISALATNLTVMIAGRVIQGAGGAVLPLAFGIIRDEFPREKVMSAIGQASALLAVGSGAGIVLAGPLVSALDYHWLFWIPAIVLALAVAATAIMVPESEARSAGRVNWTGAVLLAGWLVALLLGASEGSVWGWGSGRVVGLFAASVVLIGAWIRNESRSANPLIDMTMMRIPAVATTNLVALLIGIGMYAVFAFLPAFLQTPPSVGYGFGASITQSGFYLLPMTVCMFFAGLYSTALSNRVGAKFTLVIAGAVSVVPLAMLAFAHHDKLSIYVASGLLGVAFGFAFASMANLIVEAVPANQTGVATGMNANIRTIGGAIGGAVMASIVASGASASGLPVEAGYTRGFGFLAGACLLAMFAAIAIPMRTRVATDDHVIFNAEAAVVASAPLAERV